MPLAAQYELRKQACVALVGRLQREVVSPTVDVLEKLAEILELPQRPSSSTPSDPPRAQNGTRP